MPQVPLRNRSPGMSGQECSLPACRKPVCAPKHLTCSEVHHLLLMADRFSCLYPHNPAPPAISPQLCAFSPCSQSPLPGHSCCSRTHYLAWLRSLYQNLSRDQICKLPGCYRHIFIELREDLSLRAHEFCGWTHCTEFHIRSAQGSVSETNGRLEHSVEYLIETLKAYVRNKSSPPRNVQVDEAFFDKHPWEVLNGPEVKSCWLIARCKFKKRDQSKRELITKEGFHWKQSSIISSYSSEVLRKYLTYTRLRTRKRVRDDFEETAFTMTEYTVQNVANNEEKNYSIVKLCREQLPSAGKQSKRRAQKNLEADAEVLVQSNKDETQDIQVHSGVDQGDLTGSLVADLRMDFPDDVFSANSFDFSEDLSPGFSEMFWSILG